VWGNRQNGAIRWLKIEKGERRGGTAVERKQHGWLVMGLNDAASWGRR